MFWKKINEKDNLNIQISSVDENIQTSSKMKPPGHYLAGLRWFSTSLEEKIIVLLQIIFHYQNLVPEKTIAFK